MPPTVIFHVLLRPQEFGFRSGLTAVGRSWQDDLMRYMHMPELPCMVLNIYGELL